MTEDSLVAMCKEFMVLYIAFIIVFLKMEGHTLVLN